MAKPGPIGLSLPSRQTDLVDGETAGLSDDLVADGDDGHVRPDLVDHAGHVGSRGRGAAAASACPRVTHRSMWLRALATTRIRTSSGPSGGASISPQR